MNREGEKVDKRCLAYTWFREGAFVDVVSDFKNDLDFEYTGNNRLPPMRVVQFFLNSGSGTVKSMFENGQFLDY